MNCYDKQTVACHIGVISSNLRHINKALESEIGEDAKYAVLDNLLEDVYQRLDEIEYTLAIWDDVPCYSTDKEPTNPWYQFDRRDPFSPSDYKMD